ncbi:glycosyltransferase family 4 protein [Actinoplanes sp. NPDC049548]|uniref:glycosyltransferase family 4 protein n=1 Tax=Actinoplanes sp. NPDC049548 TaxID=3155152 RepID=UPI00343D937C
MRIAVMHGLTNGGARRRLAEQVAALDAEVIEFTTSCAEPVTARPYVVPVKLAAPGLPVALRPPQRVLDLRRLRAAWSTMGAMAQRAGVDVIFANPDSALRGAISPGKCAVPVIRYCDEPRRIDYESGLRSTLNPRSRALYAGLRRLERDTDRAAIAEADVVATNSRYTASRILAAYGRTAEVLPCGAPAMMTPAAVEPRHLLTVGSLIAGKGHDLVIEAAGRSGLGLPVVLVAHHDDRAERQRLQEIADRCGVRLNVRIGVSDDELVQIYRGAFATLYLARAEPLGLVSIEAQACGSPVIVSAEGGLPETVAAEQTGIVVLRDAAVAAQALLRLSRDGLRDRMAVAAAGTANGHSWQASAAALIRVAAALIPTQRTEVAA